VVLEIAALLEPWCPSVIDFPDVLRVGGARFVSHEVLDNLISVSVHQENTSAVSVVGGKHLASLRRLNDTSTAGEDVALGTILNHILE
jgi:hypothetical protein